MPTVRSGTRGAVITGWGTALPPKILTNADLEQMMDTNDQWIVERTGIRERHVGGTTADLSIESARQAIDMAGLATGRDRRPDPRHHDARSEGAGDGVDGAARARPVLRRLRRQRRLLRLGLRTHQRPRHDRHGRRQGPRHRHRHARPHRRLDRPQHGDPVRRRIGSRRASKPSTGPASCCRGTSTPTAAPSGSSTATSTPRCRWTARRSSGGRSA